MKKLFVCSKNDCGMIFSDEEECLKHEERCGTPTPDEVKEIISEYNALIRKLSEKGTKLPEARYLNYNYKTNTLSLSELYW